ncbi:MAG: methionine--tRNA ligase [bacterium]
MKGKNFYITTTLPYVNAEPHLGFALEIVRADSLARWQRFLGQTVFFNTGVDEHGLKIYRKAQEQKLEPQAYCDVMATKFEQLKSALNLSYDSFMRTTDPSHATAVQEFWQRCLANGDIYKKNYQVKYCVGCELEKTGSELVNNHCPEHPNQDLEIIDEENYFFKFSKYQKPLLDFYEKNPDFVMPNFRFNEIKKFVAFGLEDFSISRLQTKMPWGVAVPNDPEQVMYVWFDALINYISCLGWPKTGNYEKFWPGLQICGKDNLRQQTAMWQAMLMSAGLPNSQQVLVNGFITAQGQKMSKSLGNVINPLSLIEEYGTDAVRYYLLAELNPFEDSDYTDEKFAVRYQADLANGLGNVIARVAKMLEKDSIKVSLTKEVNQKLLEQVKAKLDKYLFNEALGVLWSVLHRADETLSNQKPWIMTVVADKAKCLSPLVQDIYDVANILQVFMPQTAAQILSQLTAEQIVKVEPLFPRIEKGDK